jgi:succinate dehydrogenase flavin-adding protein (antitoxin of CptAB toxin-antitoxin module)
LQKSENFFIQKRKGEKMLRRLTATREALWRSLSTESAGVPYMLTRPPKDTPLERDARIKRVLWRSKQRGWRELDLIVGSWATEHAHTLNDTELTAFEELLQEEIPDLYKWLSGQDAIPQLYRDNVIMQRLLKHVEKGNIVGVDPAKAS